MEMEFADGFVKKMLFFVQIAFLVPPAAAADCCFTSNRSEAYAWKAPARLGLPVFLCFRH